MLDGDGQPCLFPSVMRMHGKCWSVKEVAKSSCVNFCSTELEG